MSRTATGPEASDRPQSVRMRVADLVGAYHRHEYHAMHTHAIQLLAIARKLSDTRSTNAVDVEDVPAAASQLVDAYQNRDGEAMTRLALGLLDVAATNKRTGGDA